MYHDRLYEAGGAMKIVKQKNSRLYEDIIHGIFLILGLATVGCVLLITVYLVIAIACFFVFYPVVSGFPVSREYGMHLRLLKDWILVL